RSQRIPGEVAADRRMPGVKPGHQRRARWRAHGAAGVVADEPQAVARQTIHVGSLEHRLAVDTEVAVAKIVGLDQDDGRLRWLLRSRRCCQADTRERNKKCEWAHHFANGSGRIWKWRTLLVVPLPVSMWNGARVPTVAHNPLPFQPAFGSSIRPSIHF